MDADDLINLDEIVPKKKKGYEGLMIVKHEKASQFPEFNEDSVIALQTRNLIKKMLHELRKKGLNEKDMDEIDMLQAKRAAYEMDAFVKVSEIRSIVQGSIETVMNSFKGLVEK
jgi:hypothetical protein